MAPVRGVSVDALEMIPTFWRLVMMNVVRQQRMRRLPMMRKMGFL
jgi:hypothetical protein